MKVVLNALGQFWKDIEGARLSSYLQQRELESIQAPPEEDPQINSNPEVDEEIHVNQDGTTDRKLKSVIAINHIEVNLHQHNGSLLFTTLAFANLGGHSIEALFDTGSSTSFIRKGVIPESHMVDLDKPYIGRGVNAIPFTVKRQTKSLLLKIHNTLHKVKFLEIDTMQVSESILGQDFLEDFESYTVQYNPEPRPVLSPSSHDLVLPLFYKKNTSRAAAKRRGTNRDKAQDALNPKP